MSPKPMEPAVGDHVSAPAEEEETASNEFTPQDLAAAEHLLSLSESVGSCSSGSNYSNSKQSSDDDSKTKSSDESSAYSPSDSSESKSSSGSDSDSSSASSDDAPAPVVLIGDQEVPGMRPQKTRSLADIYAQTKPVP